MKNHLNYSLSAALFILAVMPAICGTVYGQAPAAEWTLMFYMDADNDLEGNQMRDLEEMMLVGSNSKVNIIVLADRSVKSEKDDEDDTKYSSRAIGGIRNWTTAKLVVVEKGRLRQLADWGEVNMGDPKNLVRFVKTASVQFPAKRFALVFGDHGEGWAGIAADESNDGDGLDMNELGTAFKQMKLPTGGLELIGFDACLMGNLEAAKAIAPFGKAMVASEELEPGAGWNYGPLFTNLNKNPAIDGFALGRIIVDTYRDYYLPVRGRHIATVTLGVYDLAKIPAVETAVNNFSIRSRSFMKSKGRTTWLKTADAKAETEYYGGEEDGEFYDIVHFASNTKLQTPDAQTIRTADAVATAVKAAVVYKISGTARPRSSGMSVFFGGHEEPVSETAYAKTPFSITGKWFPFVDDFHALAVGDEEAPEVENVRSTSTRITRSAKPTVTANVSADDVAETTFILAESTPDRDIIIGAIPTEPDTSGNLREEWDGSWFTIGNEDKELICPITDFEEIEPEVYLAEVPAQIRFSGGREWRDITIYFVIDFNQDEPVGEFVYAFEFKDNRAREVNLDPGDMIRPVYLSVDKDGNTDEVAATDPDDMIRIKTEDGIAVGGTDVAPGNYLIGFLTTDYADNSDVGVTAVVVE